MNAYLKIPRNLAGIDFSLLAGWALLYPHKTTLLYFLGFGALAGVFILANLFSSRPLTLSRFSTLLITANLLLVASLLFTPNRQKSLLFLSDLILVSLVVLGFENGRRDRERCLNILVFIISLVSLVTVFLLLAGVTRKPDLFFTNPILQGILSGLAAVFLVHRLVRRFAILPAVLLLINLAAVFASASKAAFIGTVLFALLGIPLRRKGWLLGLLGLVILTFLVPNPVRKMFQFSLTKDPYATNRIDIWKMSLGMVRAYWPMGTGLGSFPDAAPAHNFAQETGPARYLKIPRQPHNDYLKLLVEAGLPGLLLLLLLGAAILRRLSGGGLAHRSGTAILYLLFQALLFNLLFHLAFFLLFLFLLDDWIEAPSRYFSPTSLLKLTFAGFLPLIFIFSYILPFLSQRQLEISEKSPDFMQAFGQARHAARITPLAPEPQARLADLFSRYYTRTGSLPALVQARKHLKKTRRLNPYSPNPPLAEAALLETLISRNMKYAGLKQEILDCLDAAGTATPLDPFIRLHRAKIHMEFDSPRPALENARGALELEPLCLEALVFIQRHFPEEMDSGEFRSRVNRILAWREGIRIRPGSYLEQLFSLPPGDLGWLRAAYPDLWPAPRSQQSTEGWKIR